MSRRSQQAGGGGCSLKLVEDEQPEVRTQAVKASAGRHALIQLQSRLLLNDPSWAVGQAAATALGSHPKLQGGADLLRALAQDGDSDVGAECAKQLDRQLMSDGPATTDTPLNLIVGEGR